MLNRIKSFFIGFFSLIWVSMIASFLAGPGDIGGAEINGFFSFLLWLLFVYLIVKKHAIIASAGSTVLFFILRIYKFGVGDMSGVSDILSDVIVGIVIVFIFYNLVFGNKKGSNDRTEYRDKRIQRRNVDQYYDTDYDSDSTYTSERNTGPELVNGSDEYWKYKEAAEAIYWDFCNTSSSTERRFHKQRAERLKERLLSEYGAKDECARYIMDTFLDLRL